MPSRTAVACRSVRFQPGLLPRGCLTAAPPVVVVAAGCLTAAPPVAGVAAGCLTAAPPVAVVAAAVVAIVVSAVVVVVELRLPCRRPGRRSFAG